MDRIAIEVENPLYGTLLDVVIVWGPHTTVRVQIMEVWCKPKHTKQCFQTRI